MTTADIDEAVAGQSEPAFVLADPEQPEEVLSPASPMVLLQAAQFMILLVGALYLTRTIVLPILLAIMLKLLLQSGVRRLERIHVPRAIAALLMITVLFVTLVSMGTALSGPAHDWVAKLPEGMPRL